MPNWGALVPKGERKGGRIGAGVLEERRNLEGKLEKGGFLRERIEGFC